MLAFSHAQMLFAVADKLCTASLLSFLFLCSFSSSVFRNHDWIISWLSFTYIRCLLPATIFSSSKIRKVKKDIASHCGEHSVSEIAAFFPWFHGKEVEYCFRLSCWVLSMWWRLFKKLIISEWHCTFFTSSAYLISNDFTIFSKLRKLMLPWSRK